MPGKILLLISYLLAKSLNRQQQKYVACHLHHETQVNHVTEVVTRHPSSVKRQEVHFWYGHHLKTRYHCALNIRRKSDIVNLIMSRTDSDDVEIRITFMERQKSRKVKNVLTKFLK